MTGTHVATLRRAGWVVALLTAVLSTLLATAVSASASTSSHETLAAETSAPAAAAPAVSTFDFYNDHISHFHATLRFVNRNEFVITNVTLTHLACTSMPTCTSPSASVYCAAFCSRLDRICARWSGST